MRRETCIVLSLELPSPVVFLVPSNSDYSLELFAFSQDFLLSLFFFSSVFLVSWAWKQHLLVFVYMARFLRCPHFCKIALLDTQFSLDFFLCTLITPLPFSLRSDLFVLGRFPFKRWSTFQFFSFSFTFSISLWCVSLCSSYLEFFKLPK